MTAIASSSRNDPIQRREILFASLTGLVLGLAVLKLGNPVILNEQVARPGSFAEWLTASWPLEWGYALGLIVLVFSFRFWRGTTTVPRWLLALPLAWLFWNFLASFATVDRHLTVVTLKHFVACAAWFYVGFFSLSRVRHPLPVWIGILLALVLVLHAAMDQHFGGLAATRRAVAEMKPEEIPPELRRQLDTPEFRQKIASDRVFGTFVYPNALAGAILLLLPLGLRTSWEVTRRFSPVVRLVLPGVLGVVATACLIWSGSKAGWLVALGMLVVLLLHSGMGRRMKLALLAGLLVIGLTGFALKYSAYFQRGATSATARFDYWRAAVTLIGEHPLLGSGPGTFQIGYKRLKTPESEMARLAHNDYLQQGADAGIPGLLIYALFVGAALTRLWRCGAREVGSLRFVIWLGAAGFAAQSFVEFGLYIPALAWVFFLFLGWSLGQNGPPREA